MGKILRGVPFIGDVEVMNGVVAVRVYSLQACFGIACVCGDLGSCLLPTNGGLVRFP